MKKGFFKGAGLLVIMMVLWACGPKVPPSPPPLTPSEEAPADPLAEARQKLFDELGIKEEGINTESEASLPPVSPSPPELPKTDADWPTN